MNCVTSEGWPAPPATKAANRIAAPVFNSYLYLKPSENTWRLLQICKKLPQADLFYWRLFSVGHLKRR